MNSTRFFILPAAFLAILFGTAQTKTTPPAASGAKNQLADLIIYDVMIYNESVISMDSSQAKNLRDYEGYSVEEYNAINEHAFFSTAQGRFLRNQLRSFLRNPSVIFFRGDEIVSGELLTNAITRNLERLEVDSTGEIVGTVTFRDTIDFKKWSKITFYEEWSINSSNGAMEKKVLAYSFSYFDNEKEFWRPIVGIAADKTAFEKLRREYLDAD
mgnify:FL=1